MQLTIADSLPLLPAYFLGLVSGGQHLRRARNAQQRGIRKAAPCPGTSGPAALRPGRRQGPGGPVPFHLDHSPVVGMKVTPKPLPCWCFSQVWKRSGAWFYKGLPKYILPLKTPSRADVPHFRPLPVEPADPEHRSTEASRVYTWARGRVVSSDSDSDSDISSSSLEDRLPPTGVRDLKADKPPGESGGSTPSPRTGLARPPSLLSGSQSSLASETGAGAAEPQGGTSPQPDSKGPGKRHTRASPHC
ncbi:rab effector Noc2 isoform X3 [Dasypus novemcinctus]|uniref:rab effector Noc2 isoform X3 n=1 Tax=Dasypus novemcinctus TaxID=9361 RepID=UPI0039C98568